MPSDSKFVNGARPSQPPSATDGRGPFAETRDESRSSAPSTALAAATSRAWHASFADELCARAAIARNDPRLGDAWVDFLSRYRWDWFCTLTFRDSIHPEAADKRFRVWVGKLNRLLFGPRWHLKLADTVYWCRGLELQRRGVIHFHALIGCRTKDLNHFAVRNHWSSVWRELAGFAQVQCVRDATEALGYLTKYVSKGGEIDLSHSFKRPEATGLF